MASTSASASASASTSTSSPGDCKATSVLVIGMAGSGKSTFAGALSKFLSQEDTSKESYVVNLDPAVGSLNYEPNVDIRDTIDYKRVMEEYNLGPNGGILTSLNLFTTKFDQVLSILDRRASEVDQIILDTPGQIEIFTWSASGTIITDSLASAMPTCVAYVIDTPRTTAPATFMSNMLYACSIMYKTKLPFILVFNKTDVQPHDFALEWMSDFEAFQSALSKGNATDSIDVSSFMPGVPSSSTSRTTGSLGGGGPDGGSYMNSLMNSMALVLDEFYNNIRAVGFSSVTGQGLPDLLQAIQSAREEYTTEYLPELQRLKQVKKQKEEDRKKEQVRKLMKDMRVSGKPRGDQVKDDDDDDMDAAPTRPTYDGDGQILDPDDDDDQYLTQPAAQGQAGQQPNRRRKDWDAAAFPRPQ